MSVNEETKLKEEVVVDNTEMAEANVGNIEVVSKKAKLKAICKKVAIGAGVTLFGGICYALGVKKGHNDNESEVIEVEDYDTEEESNEEE